MIPLVSTVHFGGNAEIKSVFVSTSMKYKYNENKFNDENKFNLNIKSFEIKISFFCTTYILNKL